MDVGRLVLGCPAPPWDRVQFTIAIRGRVLLPKNGPFELNARKAGESQTGAPALSGFRRALKSCI